MILQPVLESLQKLNIKLVNALLKSKSKSISENNFIYSHGLHEFFSWLI